VAYVPGSSEHPIVGEVIADKWVVLEVISHTESERCLKVESFLK
jgi:hypothetical protein